ncbi:MAG: PhoH family protein [Brevinematia bacterium]
MLSIKKSQKVFVLDTNVPLYDYSCIFSFKDNVVVIPITLLEEIDKFKKGNELINFNAREFIRKLEEIVGEKEPDKGVPLKDGGVIVITTNIEKDEKIQEIFKEDKPDHRILSVAYNFAEIYGKERVILVSKDINLRMKAKSIGLRSEDYETGKIKNIDELYTGKRIMMDFPVEKIELLFQNGFLRLEELELEEEPYPNEYFILKNMSRSALAFYSFQDKTLKLVEKRRAYGIQPRNAEQIFSLHALSNPLVELVTLSGKAGTGKTLMALAAALETKNNYRQILLARPIVPLSNKDIGYLPGDIDRKIDPYMQPLYDNLSVILHQFDEDAEESRSINELLQSGKLQIMALAYIRGRNLSKSFFIVDEAQNLTPHEVKTIITRAGEGTKIVFTGDPYQIDTPYLDSRSNGLTYLIDRMKGQPLYAHITLEKGERSRLAELASNLL